MVDERPVPDQMVGRLAPSLEVSLPKELTFGGAIRTAALSLPRPFTGWQAGPQRESSFGRRGRTTEISLDLPEVELKDVSSCLPSVR